jgi:hypothetical protein
MLGRLALPLSIFRTESLIVMMYLAHDSTRFHLDDKRRSRTSRIRRERLRSIGRERDYASKCSRWDGCLFFSHCSPTEGMLPFRGLYTVHIQEVPMPHKRLCNSILFLSLLVLLKSDDQEHFSSSQPAVAKQQSSGNISCAASCPEERERRLNHSMSKPRPSTPTPLKTHSHQFILRFYHRPCALLCCLALASLGSAVCTFSAVR